MQVHYPFTQIILIQIFIRTGPQAQAVPLVRNLHGGNRIDEHSLEGIALVVVP